MPGWLDAFGLRFEVDLAQGANIVGRVPWLTAGSKATIDQRVSIPQRGVRNDFRGLLIADAPFGFFEVKRSFILDGRVVVLPRPMFPRGLEFSGGAMDMRDEDSAAAGGGPGELRGLRPWQAGDSVKHVTWPATLRAMARGAGWVVWECDPPRHRPAKFVLVIHSFGGDRGLIQPERFERALSFAAGILRRLHGHGILVRMLADFDDWRSRPVARGGQMAECLELLAAAKRAAGTEAHDLQAALRTVQQDECVIVLSDMHPSGWKSFLPTSVKHALTPELGGRRARKEAAS